MRDAGHERTPVPGTHSTLCKAGCRKDGRKKVRKKPGLTGFVPTLMWGWGRGRGPGGRRTELEHRVVVSTGPGFSVALLLSRIDSLHRGRREMLTT